MFPCQHFGFIDVEWDGWDSPLQDFAGRVTAESGRFRACMTGSRPSAGLAGLGLFTGFKKS